LTEGQIVLNVSTTAEGSKRVQSFTASNVGKMIVFVVNGRVTNTLKVLDPITGNGFLLGPFLREEAEKLAESINHRGSGCG
jgi:preprotein translocase subunit SecD